MGPSREREIKKTGGWKTTKMEQGILTFLRQFLRRSRPNTRHGMRMQWEHPTLKLNAFDLNAKYFPHLDIFRRCFQWLN